MLIITTLKALYTKDGMRLTQQPLAERQKWTGDQSHVTIHS